MKWLCAAAVIVTLPACTSIKPGLGFEDVSRDVSQRAGVTVHWNTGSSADAEARQAVEKLLTEELTADSAAQVALLNNRKLQAVYEELSIAQADVIQAGLLRNPIFSGEVRWATDGGGTGVVLDVSQDFLSLFFVPLRKKLAGAEFESAKLRVTAAVLDMTAQTRTGFYDALAAAQLLEMRQTVSEATAASYDLAKRLHAAGNIHDLDLANERAMYEQTRLDLASAEVGAALACEQLTDLMGLWGGDTAWRMATRLPDVPADLPDLASVESAAVSASLDLAIARTEVEAAGRALGLARPLAGIDEPEVGIAVERETDGEWSAGPSLSIPVPIFDTGRARSFAARARLRQATARHYAEAVHVRSAARVVRDAVTAARARAEYIKAVLLPLHQQIVDETQRQYNGMQVGAFQLLSAKRDQIEAGAQYVDSLRGYWLARTRLDALLAGRLPSSAEVSSTEPRARATTSGGH